MKKVSTSTDADCARRLAVDRAVPFGVALAVACARIFRAQDDGRADEGESKNRGGEPGGDGEADDDVRHGHASRPGSPLFQRDELP